MTSPASAPPKSPKGSIAVPTEPLPQTPPAGLPVSKPLLTQEYVSSYSGNSYIGTMVRALQPYIDDITRDFGIAQYDRMMTDSQVSSVVRILVMAVLAEDISYRPPVPKDDTRYPQAEQYAAFIAHVFDHIERPLPQVLDDMVTGALTNGHKVAEQVYATRTLDKKDGPRLVLSALKPKPQTATAFVSDAYGNIPGLLYQTPTTPLLTGLLSYNLADLEQQPNFMPRRKFALLTNRSVDGSPLGQSILRCVYTAWWIKQQVFPELVKYLARFGSPAVIGFTDPESQDEPDDRGVLRSPEQVMLSTLEAIRNGAAGAFPTNAKIQLLEAQREGGPFITALEMVDMQIAKGVLLQTLATEQGQHMARAASQIHQDMLGLLILFTQQTIIAMMEDDIINPLIEYNFGPDALELAPHVMMGDVSRQDFGPFAHGVAELAAQGLIHDSQIPGIMDMLNLPPADEEAVKAEQAQKDAAMASLVKANQAAQAQAATKSEVMPNGNAGQQQPAAPNGANAPAQSKGQGAQANGRPTEGVLAGKQG